MARRAGLVALTTLFLACGNGGEDRVIGVNATGSVAGAVFFDADGSGAFGSGDTEMRGVRVSLLFAGTSVEETVSATSDGDGLFNLNGVPVGRYTLVVDTTSIGDSAQVARIDTSDVEITPDDTVSVLVIISFPTTGATHIAQLSPGTKVFVEGVALNAAQAFGDTTLHVADTSGAVRVADVRGASFAVGDSVRVSGIVESRGAEFLLGDGRVTVVGIGTLPQAEEVATALAADTDTARLNAALVEVAGVTVTDTATVDDDFVVVIDDGSGPLDMVLDGDIAFQRDAFRPPAELDATGLLVTDESGARRLKPRRVGDVDLRVPFVNVAGARTATAGDTVLLNGIVLNDPGTLGDSTMNLTDGQRSIRVTQLGPIAALAGDSVLLRGVAGTRAGQPVVKGITVTVIDSVGVPDPTEISSSQAASAANGAFDAAYVKILDVRVDDTSTVAAGKLLTVTDGSGDLEVLLDTDLGLDVSEYVPGIVAEIEGILIPAGAGKWRLVPRSADDITVKVPFVTISEARASLPGDTVAFAGVALNDRTAFGDNTVHVADTSGTMRAVGVTSPNIFAGDSIRLRGIINLVSGQPVLDQVSAEVVGSGTVPASTPLTSAAAGSADGGTRDAGFVHVDSTTIRTRSSAGADVSLTVNDGSGDLTVVIDGNAGIDAAALQVGAVVDFAGVLIPTGTGKWNLKPRRDSDVNVRIFTIASVRTLPQGDTASVVGIALNDPGIFGDSTMHVDDGTAAIRVTQLATNPAVAGDSLLIRGVIGSRAGQPVLQGLQTGAVTVLGATAIRDTTVLGSAAAATASSGSEDAALVRVNSFVVSDTTTTNGDRIVTGNSGTGDLRLRLDADLGLDLTPYVPGVMLDVVGVLVPTGTGSWRLVPRSAADIDVRVPFLSISAARAALQGDTVVFAGVSSNNLTVFGDGNLFVTDATGSIRAFNVTGTVFQGDSVRLRGIINLVNGQPVLNMNSGIAGVTVLANTVVPAPTTVATGTADGAAGGSLDAALVRVDSATISARSGVGDIELTVNDGSGDLTVIIDGSAGINATKLVEGAVADFQGVLVATNAGKWQLKPRATSDVPIVIPVVTIGDATDTTKLRVDTVVTVEGVVLNQWDTFGDSTVHLIDVTGGTGAIRTIRTPQVFLLIGDRVRATGTLDTLNRQRVLRAPTINFLSTGAEPGPVSVSTNTAAIAFGGRRDGELVRVGSPTQVTVSDTATTTTGFEVTVNDGSGSVIVLLDVDAGLSVTGLVPGATGTAQGLLVARPNGSWVLKPRRNSDVVIN